MRWILLAVFVLASLGVAAVGQLYYTSQTASIMREKSLELAAIRDLKVGQVEQWRANLLADGQLVVHDGTIGADIRSWLASSSASSTVDLRSLLDAIVSTGGYSEAYLIAPDTKRWIQSTGASNPDAETLEEATAPLHSREATLTDLFLDEETGRPTMHVLAPVMANGTKPLASLILRRDPARDLYPLIQSWPTPSGSGETLLIRHDDGHVLYLNDLRFKKDAALKSQLPVSQTNLLAVQALSGEARSVTGIDYRGMAVLGAVSPIPGTSWFIVAKVDQAEAYAGIVDNQRGTLLAVALVILAVGLGLGAAWRQQTVALYRQRLATETELRRLTEQYDYLTEYANDAVILVDAEMRIIQVNERASTIYGFTRDELLTMKLPALQHGDAPTWAARLEEGAVESLMTEVAQARKDGTEFFAEVSAQAIVTDAGVEFLGVLRDVTERKEADEAVATSERKFRSIVESSPNGIYLARLETDGRLVLTDTNPSADQVLGIDTSKLVGLTLEEAFPNVVGTEIPEMYRAIARGELESQTYEIDYADQNIAGAYNVSVFAIGDNTIVVDFLDITERRRAEAELRERTDDLVRSNSELEKFAYIASHDLQEPLRMVASYTQLLQRRYEGKLDADADDFIGYAVDGATRMQQLINELLAYSRVGTQGAPFVSANLEEVFERVLRVLGPSMRDAGAAITHDPLPEIVCDPTQVGQVLQNLLSNALKFHGAEPPVINVSAKRLEGEWEFCVSDNGIGIDPEYFERIFVIFQRLKSRAEYPGTGMGLAICKRIVERHGGRIWVESEEGKGSVFCFTIRDLMEG